MICNSLIFIFSYFCLIKVYIIKNGGVFLTVDIVSVFGSVLILQVSLSRFIMSSRFHSEPSTLFHMFLAGNVHEFKNTARHMIFNNKNILKRHKRESPNQSSSWLPASLIQTKYPIFLNLKLLVTVKNVLLFIYLATSEILLWIQTQYCFMFTHI